MIIILSPEEYASLYSTQQSSMVGIGYDNSEIPNFTAAVGIAEDDEPEDKTTSVTTKNSSVTHDPPAKNKTVVTSSVPSRISPVASTPISVTGQKNMKPTAGKIDTSSIVVGSKLTHKAFGTGIVKSVDTQYIIIDFNGSEKKFMFPAAILQGFLKIN